MSVTPVITRAGNDAAARTRDAVLWVKQNNALKTLQLVRANPAAAAMLGYAEGDLPEMDLARLLSASANAMLAEEIEYADDAPDFGDVLSRQNSIRLRHQDGHELAVEYVVSRLMAEGMNACFQLVIPDGRAKLAKQKIRDFIALNLDGRKQLDAATGLPDYGTAQSFLPLLQNYLREIGIEACFAVLRIDRHPKNMALYGAAGCTTLLQHAAQCCRTSFRSEDIIFALSDHELGVVLIDLSHEGAQVVLNRLRWKIRSHRIDFGGKPDFSVTVSVCFDSIKPEEDDASVMERCANRLRALDSDERNSLIDATQ